MNAATRRRRGDEVARMRGHNMWHDRERLGCPSLPCPLRQCLPDGSASAMIRAYCAWSRHRSQTA
eukprot:3715453-Prymnesium_polylepis.1